MNEKINELVNRLTGQFADKGDTRKRLNNIEKNVNPATPSYIISSV